MIDETDPNTFAYLTNLRFETHIQHPKVNRSIWLSHCWTIRTDQLRPIRDTWFDPVSKHLLQWNPTIDRVFQWQSPRLEIPRWTTRSSAQLGDWPLSSDCRWGSFDAPPKITVVRHWASCPNCWATVDICWANSRVGAMISTMGPSPGRTNSWWLAWIIPGNMKANVFPEPVKAIPIRSRPDNRMGHEQDWIKVGFWYPHMPMVSITGSRSPIERSDGGLSQTKRDSHQEKGLHRMMRSGVVHNLQCWFDCL